MRFLIVLVAIVLCFLTCTALKVKAQDQIVHLKSLKVGDALPADFWTREHTVYRNKKVVKQNLTPYKGKLFILDFWATWCVVCIKEMADQQNIGTKFNDELQIIRISTEDFGTVDKFGVSKRNPLGESLRSIFSDHYLSGIFPHQYLPHLVWIDKYGIIQAFTDGSKFNIQNIKNALYEGHWPSSTKVFNNDIPLYMDINPEDLAAVNLLLKGRVEGLNMGNLVREKDGKMHLRIKNLPIGWLYNSLAMMQYDWFSSKRIKLDPELETAFNNRTYVPEELWTIDFWGRFSNKADLSRAAMVFLNQNSGYHVNAVIVEQDCFELLYREADAVKPLLSNGGQIKNTIFRKDGELVNAPLKFFCLRLEDQPWISLPIIDKTGFQKPVDLPMASCDNIEDLNRLLKPYGLLLKQNIRPMEMLVVKKVNQLTQSNYPQ